MARKIGSMVGPKKYYAGLLPGLATYPSSFNWYNKLDCELMSAISVIKLRKKVASLRLRNLIISLFVSLSLY